MSKIISSKNLTSVLSQSGGYLSSGFHVNRNVANLNLNGSTYVGGFKQPKLQGGAVRGGTEPRTYNGRGGAIRGGTEPRTYIGRGGAIRGGTEPRTYIGRGGAVRGGTEPRTYIGRGGASRKKSHKKK